MIQLRKYFLLFITCFLLLNVGCRKTIQLNIQDVLLDTLTTRNFEDMLFINKDTGFIVGGNRFEDGLFVYTFDGGSSWKIKDSISPWIIYSIASTPNKRIFSTGIVGRILELKNNRIKWDTSQLWGAGNDFLKLTFVNDSLGFAVGGASNSNGVIQKFDGKNWSADFQIIPRIVNAIQMLNAKVGYIATFGAVYKTIDGGNTWNICSVEGDNFNALYFFNEQHGFVIGANGTLIETTDGGNSWNRKRNGNSPFTASWQFNSIAFSTESVGYIAGANGLLLKTTDGGEHWKKSNYFSSQAVRKIYVQSSNLIWLAGDKGTLYKLIED